MTHTDGTEPWDVASLRRAAEAAVADVGASGRAEAVRWLTEQQLAVLTAGPTPVEGLVTAALLRQDSVTITEQAAADLARTLYYADLLRDQSGPAGVQDRVRLDAIRRLHAPFDVYDECDCKDKTVPGHVEVGDIGWTCELMYQVCTTCCTDGEYQSEECTYHHGHGQDVPICPTAVTLDADLDGA